MGDCAGVAQKVARPFATQTFDVGTRGIGLVNSDRAVLQLRRIGFRPPRGTILYLPPRNINSWDRAGSL